jgi:hypothetical protein
MEIDNMNNNFDLDLGDFGGSSVGAEVAQKWAYPTIGYESSEGIIYVDNTPVTGFDGVVFAIRQCKEVEAIAAGGAKVRYRYPVYKKTTDMVKGDVRQRLQALILIDGQLHALGASSWTPRATFINPRKEGKDAKYHNDKFHEGLWYQIEDLNKEIKKERGIDMSPLCWKVSFTTGPQFTLASASDSKMKTKVHPLVATIVGFVGADAVAENEALYVEQDIDGWKKAWGTDAVETESGGDDDGEAPANPLPDELGALEF